MLLRHELHVASKVDWPTGALKLHLVVLEADWRTETLRSKLVWVLRGHHIHEVRLHLLLLISPSCALPALLISELRRLVARGNLLVHRWRDSQVRRSKVVLCHVGGRSLSNALENDWLCILHMHWQKGLRLRHLRHLSWLVVLLLIFVPLLCAVYRQ